MKNLILKDPYYKALEKEFKCWLSLLGYSESTVYSLPSHIREFFYYLERAHVKEISAITSRDVESFFDYLRERNNKRRGGGLSSVYLNKYVQALKNLNHYLRQTYDKGFNIEIDRIKQEQNIRKILSLKQIQSLYEACEGTILGIRDRAMLAVLYGCGLRRNEAVSLNVKDILFKPRILYVRKGKNYKERYVPFTESISRDLEDYLSYSRPFIAGKLKTEALFISKKGRRIEGQSLMLRLKGLAEKINYPKDEIDLHTLRHSIATHLLKEGMKLEYIGQFLGHKSLESTQIYTRITA